MNENHNPLIDLFDTLNRIPEISFEVPELLIRLNNEGVTLGELDEGMQGIEEAVELVSSHSSGSQAVQRKLCNLPPQTIPDGIPIGF
jgi:hypothetical protein